jgi:hypothetical protein
MLLHMDFQTLTGYVSHVLPATKQHQPGIINNGIETVSIGFNDYRCSGCIGEKCRSILIVYERCSDAR